MPRLFCILSLSLLLPVFETACHKRKLGGPPAAAPTAIPDSGLTTTPAQSTTSSAPGSITTAPSTTTPANQVTPPPSAPVPVAPPGTTPATQPAPTSAEPVTPPRRPARTPASSPPAPSPPGAPPANGQPAPQLGPILTEEQQRQHNSAIDQSLARAQSSLGSIGKRQLNKEQQTDFDQIQGFIQQAQALRGSDLPAARRLAEKAEVLARNLAKNVQ